VAYPLVWPLQCMCVCCPVFRRVFLHVLQHVAGCGRVLLSVAVRCSVLPYVAPTLYVCECVRVYGCAHVFLRVFWVGILKHKMHCSGKMWHACRKKLSRASCLSVCERERVRTRSKTERM